MIGPLTAQVTGNKSALEESAETYYAMLKYWPAHYKSWVNMANLLPALGRYDEAVTASWEGIQLAPDMCASFTQSGPRNRQRAGSLRSYTIQQAGSSRCCGMTGTHARSASSTWAMRCSARGTSATPCAAT